VNDLKAFSTTSDLIFIPKQRNMDHFPLGRFGCPGFLESIFEGSYDGVNVSSPSINNRQAHMTDTEILVY